MGDTDWVKFAVIILGWVAFDLLVWVVAFR
jgi:hypothetical protein